jgi:hypothetical protein
MGCSLKGACLSSGGGSTACPTPGLASVDNFRDVAVSAQCDGVQDAATQDSLRSMLLS